MLFDTHAHYDDTRFNEDRYKSIEKAHDSGVSYILNASSDIASCIESVSLAQEFDYVYAAVGIHPHSTADMNDRYLEILSDFSTQKHVVAIGEIGLDYHYDFAPRDIQKLWFRKQLQLAISLNLPVIIHNRESYEDMIDIIRSENVQQVGGVLHCFSGSIEMARELLNHNFYLSFGGAVTFKNARKVMDVVKFIPEDRMLIETDCPYMTPEPYRGRRNESVYVRLVAEKIAEIRNVEFERIATNTTKNAKTLFRID